MYDSSLSGPKHHNTCSVRLLYRHACAEEKARGKKPCPINKASLHLRRAGRSAGWRQTWEAICNGEQKETLRLNTGASRGDGAMAGAWRTKLERQSGVVVHLAMSARRLFWSREVYGPRHVAGRGILARRPPRPTRASRHFWDQNFTRLLGGFWVHMCEQAESIIIFTSSARTVRDLQSTSQ